MGSNNKYKSAAIEFQEKPHLPGNWNSGNNTWMVDIHFTGSKANLSFQPQITNRVLCQNPNKFIHISFGSLFFEGNNGFQRYLAYIENILTNGVRVGSQLFLYCGQSNSQLKSRSCFLYAAENLDESASIIYRLGNFDQIKYVGKRAKRIGLLFSNSDHVFSLKSEETADIEDIERNGKVFTDGCGIICEKFATEITKKMNANRKKNWVDFSYTPKIFQIRYKGYKGILMVARNNEFNSAVNAQAKVGLFSRFFGWFSGSAQTEVNNASSVKVKFRQSMRKFEDCPINDFCILEHSKPGSSGRLNAELVSILSTLGIPDKIFLQKQNEYFSFIRNASKSVKQAHEFLEYKGRYDLVYKLRNVRNLDTASLTLQGQIKALQKHELLNSFDKYDIERIHIRIPNSRLLFGVCDISGKLEKDQCFVRITTDRGQMTSENIVGRILVGRNPCLHPGDIQFFNSVANIPELEHLVDCIVFSTKGKLPPASLLSGGDLDGDKFLVCWDPELYPKTVDPLDYSLLQPSIAVQESIGPEDMINYFVHYSTSLGEVMNLYWAWIRSNSKERASSKECVLLNELYSKCVDGERVQIPSSLRNPPKSTDPSKPFILDTLKINLKKSFEGRFDKFLDDNTDADHCCVDIPDSSENSVVVWPRIKAVFNFTYNTIWNICWMILIFLCFLPKPIAYVGGKLNKCRQQRQLAHHN